MFQSSRCCKWTSPDDTWRVLEKGQWGDPTESNCLLDGNVYCTLQQELHALFGACFPKLQFVGTALYMSSLLSLIMFQGSLDDWFKKRVIMNSPSRSPAASPTLSLLQSKKGPQMISTSRSVDDVMCAMVWNWQTFRSLIPLLIYYILYTEYMKYMLCIIYIRIYKNCNYSM